MRCLVMLRVAPTTQNDQVEKVWSGPKPKTLFHADMTLGEAVLYLHANNPERIVQVMADTGEELTSERLVRQAKNLARNLIRMGLQVGDVVGIFANNNIHISSVFLGALLCGTPTNAAYPDFNQENVELIFGVTRPKVIFCEIMNYTVAKQVSDALQLEAKIYVMHGEFDKAPHVCELFVECVSLAKDPQFGFEYFPCKDLTSDDVALILCSSGTTGPPKGMMITHAALLGSPVLAFLGPQSVIFNYSTLYWVSGTWMLITALLHGVKQVISTRKFEVDHFLKVIQTFRVTHILAGPGNLTKVSESIDLTDPTYRKTFASLVFLMCGGSRVPRVLAEQWRQILCKGSGPGLVIAYGFSEITTAVSQNWTIFDSRLEAGEGQLMANIEATILDENGHRLGINERGLLCVRTPHNWPGYYRNPEATAKAMHKGWNISGDIAFFDEHHNLHICSRHSDVFKSHGFQIYPPHIEEIVLRIPGVSEACIFGVPDVKAINLIACAIVRQHNEEGRRLTAADIEARVRQELADHLQLEAGVYFLDVLPKTATEKVQRHKVLHLIQTR